MLSHTQIHGFEFDLSAFSVLPQMRCSANSMTQWYGGGRSSGAVGRCNRALSEVQIIDVPSQDGYIGPASVKLFILVAKA